MRIMTRFAALAAITTLVVPAAAFYLFWAPSNDPLGDKLRGFGFFPVEPPNTLMDLGALYYINSAVSEFVPICHAEKADLEAAMSELKSIQIEEDLRQDGSLTTKLKVDFGSLVNGVATNSYVEKVHFSLTDVVLQEIALGSNSMIYEKLMNKPECSSVAVQLMNTGYVCQGQRILRATAEYKLDLDTLNKLGAQVDATPGKAADVVKVGIDTQSNEKVMEREGKLLSGSALDYGVVFTPTCLAPKNARFPRVLPTTMVGRAVNFILYRVVEPLLPPMHDDVDVAQSTHT